MAIARVTLTCAECGKEFGVREKCFNRREADNREEWLKNQSDRLCPDCYRASIKNRKARRAAELMEQHGYTLPEITGVSKKQIDFARDVRDGYLADHPDLISTYFDWRKWVEDNAQQIEAACQQMGCTTEHAIDNSCKAYHLDAVRLMLTASDARTIIDHRED